MVTETTNVEYKKDDMDIKKRYITTFFGDLVKSQKDEIYFDQYMWHAFSYGIVKAENGEAAIKRLRDKSENSVYVFFQKNDIIIEEENITYDEIYDNIWNTEIWDRDCYVVDKDFRWTFVVTHETYMQGGRVTNKGRFIPDGTWDLYVGPFFKSL